MAQLRYVGDNITKYGAPSGVYLAGKDSWQNVMKLGLADKLSAYAKTAFVTYNGPHAGEVSLTKVAGSIGISAGLSAGVSSLFNND